jgi:integrase
MLTAKFVERHKKPGRYTDDNGLYLQIKNDDNRSWLFRYERDGVERWMGLGPTHTVSLKEAREKARKARQQLLDDIDPIDARKEAVAARKLAAAKMMTFKECADAYIVASRSQWRNIKHSNQWTSTLKTYAYPIIGALPVSAIDTGLVLKVLEQNIEIEPVGSLWATRPETASRVRQRIEAVLGWATVRGYRSGDNPARWKNHLEAALLRAGGKTKHHPSLPYDDMPTFMARLRAKESISARALEFCILTATRTSEVIKAKWDEMDFDKLTWTIPAERMKANREHKVPLSDRAMAIIENLPHEEDNPFIFVGANKGKPLGQMALLQVLRGLRTGLVVHGFRSTFRTWCAERTSYEHMVAELALGHTQSDKLLQAYQRGDLFDKRRRLMADWANYCASLGTAITDNVRSIRGVGSHTILTPAT